jgi:hypothetical protein
MPKVLYLFPDTNAFVQCRPLEQVDWSAWKDFDEVHLIVSRPVQSEIDNQKNKGAGRLGKRARTASSLFREVIRAGTGHKVIQESGPSVKLSMRQDLKPSPELADRLSYEEPDDQLVGIAHAFAKQTIGADVGVLTHDTGPLLSAQMVRVPFVEIPDGWLLPPETNEAEKEINALQTELARLKKAEPEFKIVCLDGEGNEVKKLEIEAVRYVPLTEDQVSGLMQRLKERFPIATEFGSPESAERDGRIGTRGFLREVFTPATEKEIASYRDKQYPKWLDDCERALRDLHQNLEGDGGVPTFCFAITNEGTRPAKDALITIKAKGDFTIMPPDQNDEDAKFGPEPLELPRPPEPPRGNWQPKPLWPAGASISALQRAMGDVSAQPLPDLSRIIPALNVDRRRDPNGFYWKPRRPIAPASEFSRECEQWRHGIEAKRFEGEISFGSEQEIISGALECRIHAENMSNIARMCVPVRIHVRRVKAYDSAMEMAERLSS